MPLIAWTQITPRYQTNDDVAMRLLAEGNFVPEGRPSEFLLLVNALIGKLLRLAYVWMPQLPWYDLLLMATTTLAAGVLVAVWAGRGWRSFFWTSLLAGFFLLPLFVVVQFTLVGLTSLVAGFMLLVRAAVEPLAANSRRVHLWLGAGLFAWGGMIRFEGPPLTALLGGALALPLAVAVGRSADGRRQLRRASVGVGAAITLLGLATLLDRASYQRTYVRALKDLGEYAAFDPSAAQTMADLQRKVGWSANDLAMLRNYFFTDPQLFNLRQLDKATSVLYPRGRLAAVGQRIESGRALEIARRFMVESKVAFVVLTLFVIAHAGWRPQLFFYFLGTYGLVVLFVIAIELGTKAAPERVSWPMLILEASMVVLAARRWGKPINPKISVALCLYAGLLAVRDFPPIGKQRLAMNHEATVRDVNRLQESHAELYVIHAAAFPYEDYWRPFRDEGDFPFIGLGASAQLPPLQDFLERTGRSDLPLSLCTEPRLLLITDPSVPPMLTTFLREHHGLEAKFEQAFHCERFAAWRCHVDAAPN